MLLATLLLLGGPVGAGSHGPGEDPLPREVVRLPGGGALLVDLETGGRKTAFAATVRQLEAYWGTGEFADAEEGEAGLVFRLGHQRHGSGGARAFVSFEALEGRTLEEAARDTLEELPTRVRAARCELGGEPSGKKGKKRNRFETANGVELDVWRVRYSVERRGRTYNAEMQVMVYGSAVLRVSVEDEAGGLDYAELFPAMLHLVSEVPDEARTVRHHESPGGDRRFVEFRLPGALAADRHPSSSVRRSWTARRDDGRWKSRLSLSLHYERGGEGLADAGPILERLVGAVLAEHGASAHGTELDPLPAGVQDGRRIAFVTPVRTASESLREVRTFLVQEGVVWELRLESWFDSQAIEAGGAALLALDGHSDDQVLAQVLASFAVN
jgi:hypothetical protein